MSTRRQALDVPISGPTVEIDALSEDQQLTIARALRGAAGESILDHAWRTPGIRDLVGIPLYLTTVLAHTVGDRLPTTKEEVFRLFISEHERAANKAEALFAATYGFHGDMLAAIAVEATKSGSVIVPDNRARAAIKLTEDQLIVKGQLSDAPQPTAILEALISHHILVRSGMTSGSVSFQHQQFQEFYAAAEVEALMRASADGDLHGRGLLRKEVLNEYAWEESILFACERTSRTDEAGAKAVAAAVREALTIDPMLAAEMIYRSSPELWARTKDDVIRFGMQWHQPGQIDRAVRFMINTGRREFASLIWPLRCPLQILRPDPPRFAAAQRIAHTAHPCPPTRSEARFAVSEARSQAPAQFWFCESVALSGCPPLRSAADPWSIPRASTSERQSS
jgi:hypothetical protein